MARAPGGGFGASATRGATIWSAAPEDRPATGAEHLAKPPVHSRPDAGRSADAPSTASCDSAIARSPPRPTAVTASVASSSAAPSSFSPVVDEQ